MIFRELADNAMDAVNFSSEAFVEYTVTYENGEITLVIADTGLGFSPEKVENLTSAFCQAERDERPTSGTYGIGFKLVLISLENLHSRGLRVVTHNQGFLYSWVMRLSSSGYHIEDFFSEPAEGERLFATRIEVSFQCNRNMQEEYLEYAYWQSFLNPNIIFTFNNRKLTVETLEYMIHRRAHETSLRVFGMNFTTPDINEALDENKDVNMTYSYVCDDDDIDFESYVYFQPFSEQSYSTICLSRSGCGMILDAVEHCEVVRTLQRWLNKHGRSIGVSKSSIHSHSDYFTYMHVSNFHSYILNLHINLIGKDMKYGDLKKSFFEGVIKNLDKLIGAIFERLQQLHPSYFGSLSIQKVSCFCSM